MTDMLEGMGKETADLIERLKNYYPGIGTGTPEICLEAATALAAKDAEIVTAQEAMKAALDDLDNGDEGSAWQILATYFRNRKIDRAALAAKGK